MAKIPVRQREPRFSLSRDSDARFCQSAPAVRRLRSVLRRAAARQSAMLLATSAPGEPRVAVELLFCMGCRTSQRVHAGVRFSAGIRGSFPPARPNLLGVYRDPDLTFRQLSVAAVLETSKTLDPAGAPRPKVQRRSGENKASHRANISQNGCRWGQRLIVRSWRKVRPSALRPRSERFRDRVWQDTSRSWSILLAATCLQESAPERS